MFLVALSAEPNDPLPLDVPSIPGRKMKFSFILSQKTESLSFHSHCIGSKNTVNRSSPMPKRSAGTTIGQMKFPKPRNLNKRGRSKYHQDISWLFQIIYFSS